jgi:DNA repair protein RecN (Recombination protein N)
MLAQLRIKNLAIIEDLELDFGPGMNVITGETGAGKSILLKGLKILTGSKAKNDLIRHGATKCEVEGVFHVSPEIIAQLVTGHPALEERLECEELVIKRVIDGTGKGKCYINGGLISRGELEHIGALLIDISAQHESESLLNEDSYGNILDSFGVSTELLGKVAEGFKRYSSAKKKLDEFRNSGSEKAEYFRRIGFEKEELEKLSPQAGEKEELQQQAKKLASSDTVKVSLDEISTIIDDAAQGMLSQGKRVKTLFAALKEFDSECSRGGEIASELFSNLSEMSYLVGQIASKLEYDPAELEKIRDRISEISRIERKYSKTEAELEIYLKTIASELSQFQAGAFAEEALQTDLLEAEKALDILEQKLSAERRKIADKFQQQVEKGLRELQMKHTRFVVEIAKGERSMKGSDKIIFQFTANPGEPLRPLNSIASGGELSRVLLILKTLSPLNPTLQVFDEIDTGIGGAVSQIVGEKIRSLSKLYQVITITHAPQIASLAETHIRIEKEVKGEITRTKATNLSHESRVEEIARMLAGKKMSEHFKSSAEELLKG